jgi:hypothetical protein
LSLSRASAGVEDSSFAKIEWFPVATWGRSLKLARKKDHQGRREAQQSKDELYRWLAQDLTEAGLDGFSRTAHHDKYGVTLVVHGEDKNAIKKKAQEEFEAWANKFKQVLNDDADRAQTWAKLTSQCDERRLRSRLFLFSHPDETALDLLVEAWRVLAKEIDGLIPKCVNSMSRFITRAKLLQQMNSDVGAIFEDQFNLIEMTRAHLSDTRELARRMGSRKPNARSRKKTHARDFYLYAMAREAHKATGHDQFGGLVTLLGIAFAAHGKRDRPLNEASWRRRLERYIKRTNLPPLSA